MKRGIVDDLQVALEDVGFGDYPAPAPPSGRRFPAPTPIRSRRGRNDRSPPGTWLGLSRDCCSIEPRTDSTRWATPTTTPGLTPIPLRMTSPFHRSPSIERIGHSQPNALPPLRSCLNNQIPVAHLARRRLPLIRQHIEQPIPGIRGRAELSIAGDRRRSHMAGFRALSPLRRATSIPVR